jgi:hypothetical protein
MKKLKCQKLTFDKITLSDLMPRSLIMDRKSRLSVCDEPIRLSVISALLLIHPMVVDQNLQLIGGLNTYLELEIFLNHFPHERKTKFNVLVVESALSPDELELFNNLQNVTEPLFLAKFLPSPNELLSQANQHISAVAQFKESLVKSNGQLNHQKFSRELGRHNIRSAK